MGMMPTGISSRPARSEDTDFITDCFLRSMFESITACRGVWDEAHERAQFECQFNLEATKVIQVDDADVGFIMCAQQQENLQIHTLCVAPEYQGRGIGSHVTMEVVNRARQTGGGVVLSVLKANARAEALYRRLGFAVVEESEHHRHMKHTSESLTTG
jgi:ribosomal protein S18 acetylase RimI-like enzyme